MAYKDQKKHWWYASTLLPLVAVTGAVAYQLTEVSGLLLLPLLIVYVLIPLADVLLPNDPANPPESVVPDLENDPHYQQVLYWMLPLHLFAFGYLMYVLCNEPLLWWQSAIVLLTLGVYGGLAVNLGHELGHKKNGKDQWLAKLALATGFYGHFTIEHNAGHHRQVATPEDSASARVNENIYQFFIRECPGGFKRAWQIESARLKRKGLPWWSLENNILHSNAMSLLIALALLLVFGWQGLLFWVLHLPIVWWQLTSANYVEHYGLLRKKTDQGQYERCQPHHSWNANHTVSNLVLFHLQRHSDHHANPSRSFQSLRHFDDVPQLPAGYMGMFLLAYVPPLWFKVMNPKLTKVAGECVNVG